MVGKLVRTRRYSPGSPHKATMTLPQACTGLPAPGLCRCPVPQALQGTSNPPWLPKVVSFSQNTFLFLHKDGPVST